MSKRKPAPPRIDGKSVLLAVGRKYASRTLGYAIERALKGQPLNGEQRVIFISLRCQLEEHWLAEHTKKEKSK